MAQANRTIQGDQEALEALPEPWRFDEVYGTLYKRKVNGAPGGPAFYIKVFHSATAQTLHEAVAEYFNNNLA